MWCPRCRRPLDVVQEAAYSALLCPSCGGIFYTEEEFHKHLEAVRLVLPPNASKQELEAGQNWGRLSIGERRATCPGCSGPLQPLNYGYHSNIILARCPSCCGLWVEAGQMLQVARYHLQHPNASRVLDRMAERAEKQAEADARYERSKARLSLIPIPLLPVSNAIELRGKSIMMWVLIAVNSLLFLFIQITKIWWPLVPAEISAGKQLYTLLTHQFTHLGFWHYFGNMVGLRAFGDRVEDRLGRLGLLGAYLGFGLVAGLAHAFIMPTSEIPMIGASGAVFGIMGVYLALFPLTSMRLSGVFFSFPFPSILYIGIYLVLNMAMPVDGQIAVGAHLGGFFAGLWLGLAIRIIDKGRLRRQGEAK